MHKEVTGVGAAQRLPAASSIGLLCVDLVLWDYDVKKRRSNVHTLPSSALQLKSVSPQGMNASCLQQS